jgi:cysteine desulfurase
MMGAALYLDNNATAPLRPAAVAAMQAAMGPPANPSSVHFYGRQARLQVESARADVAMLAGSRPSDIVFTSGGTEANNLALSGFRHVITSAVEHDSVLGIAHNFSNVGNSRAGNPRASNPSARKMTVIDVDPDGRINLAHLEAILGGLEDTSNTPLEQTIVSVMAANNETGVIQPLEAIVALTRKAGVAVHSDMVQVLGKSHLDFAASGLDFASLSAHKIGGPTGVGALIVRPGQALSSLLRGGGQEGGRRSGTENFLGIAGFGAAAKAAFEDVGHYRQMGGWRDALEAQVMQARQDVTIFGRGVDRIPNTSCLAVGSKSSETMVMALDLAGFAVSAGSACSSGKVHESYVLKAMQAGEGAARAIRVSGGWQTRAQDFEKLAEVLAEL